MSFPESDCNSSSAGTLLGKGSQEAPGNGAEKGVDIRYIREQSAMMGTWGSLQRGFPERLQRVTSTVSRGGGGGREWDITQQLPRLEGKLLELPGSSLACSTHRLSLLPLGGWGGGHGSQEKKPLVTERQWVSTDSTHP